MRARADWSLDSGVSPSLFLTPCTCRSLLNEGLEAREIRVDAFTSSVTFLGTSWSKAEILVRTHKHAHASSHRRTYHTHEATTNVSRTAAFLVAPLNTVVDTRQSTVSTRHRYRCSPRSSRSFPSSRVICQRDSRDTCCRTFQLLRLYLRSISVRSVRRDRRMS